MKFTRNSAVAAYRLCRRGPLLEVGSYQLAMTRHARDLAKLLTIDMARVCLADAATAHAPRNHDFRGAPALLVAAQAADTALAVRRLRQAGATTIDFAHGWSGERIPYT